MAQPLDASCGDAPSPNGAKVNHAGCHCWLAQQCAGTVPFFGARFCNGQPPPPENMGLSPSVACATWIGDWSRSGIRYCSTHTRRPEALLSPWAPRPTRRTNTSPTRSEGQLTSSRQIASHAQREFAHPSSTATPWQSIARWRSPWSRHAAARLSRAAATST